MLPPKEHGGHTSISRSNEVPNEPVCDIHRFKYQSTEAQFRCHPPQTKTITLWTLVLEQKARPCKDRPVHTCLKHSAHGRGPPTSLMMVMDGTSPSAATTMFWNRLEAGSCFMAQAFRIFYITYRNNKISWCNAILKITCECPNGTTEKSQMHPASKSYTTETTRNHVVWSDSENYLLTPLTWGRGMPKRSVRLWNSPLS